MVSRLDTKTELGAIKELKEEYLEPFMHLMMQYECAMLEVQTKLEVLNKELALVNSRNPFESIKARLKSPESIYGKMQRKGIPFSIENIEKNLTDIAGIRVICLTCNPACNAFTFFLASNFLMALQTSSGMMVLSSFKISSMILASICRS